jgi:heme-degrading monooxygenase HmoA
MSWRRLRAGAAPDATPETHKIRTGSWAIEQVLAAGSSSDSSAAAQVDPAVPALQGGTMIMRIWRTQVDEARAAEYERFAAQQSLPMFRAHQGFEGHLFGRRGGDCVVVTIWKDDAAADALEASPRYRDTVARINAAGFLTGPSQVDRFQLHGGMGVTAGDTWA